MPGGRSASVQGAGEGAGEALTSLTYLLTCASLREAPGMTHYYINLSCYRWKSSVNKERVLLRSYNDLSSNLDTCDITAQNSIFPVMLD